MEVNEMKKANEKQINKGEIIVALSTEVDQNRNSINDCANEQNTGIALNRTKLTDITLGYNMSDKQVLFSDITKAFLLQKQYQIKESTYAHYVWLIESHIMNYFGNIPISSIDSSMIEEYISLKINHGKINSDAGLSPKTVKDIISLLKSIIRYGIERGKVENRDLLDVKLPKNVKRNIALFTKSEREIIEKNTICASDLYFGIYLSLYTGMRLGELCALKWSDIDLENEYISINKTITRIKNTQSSASKTKILIDAPKSESSIRLIPLSKKITLQLKEREPLNKEFYVLSGTERYIEPRNYYEKYNEFLKKHGIAKHPFHALRHSFATNCIEKGFDPKVLSEILGHADVKITLDRYVHPSWERKKSCMQML